MLIRHKERLYPKRVNIITLEKDGWYYYVSRELYDQAVILNYKFKDDMSFFIDIFGKEFTDEVNMFKENAPTPINVFAPYLLLIDRSDDLDVDIELLTGALHQVLTVINAVSITTVPAEVRATINFSLSIYEEFKPAWEAFLAECNTTVGGEVGTSTTAVTSTKSKPSKSENVEVTKEDEADALNVLLGGSSSKSEDSSDDDDDEDDAGANSYGLDFSDGSWDLILNDGSTELTEDETKELEKSKPAPEPEPEPEPEPQTGGGGLSFLKRGGFL